MKLNVPFYVQGLNECGSVALQMVFEFFGEKHSRDEIKKLVDSESSGTTWTLGLAKAAAQLGFKTEFYTLSLGFNPELFTIEYYQKETDGSAAAEAKLKRLLAECKVLNVMMKEQHLSVDEIVSKLNEDCLAIVLLDWSKIDGRQSFVGHFVTIVGYDDAHIYVHDPGTKRQKPFFPVEKVVFDAARRSKGTDEDIIFIHRKR
jgi:hypothetical protein